MKGWNPVRFLLASPMCEMKPDERFPLVSVSQTWRSAEWRQPSRTCESSPPSHGWQLVGPSGGSSLAEPGLLLWLISHKTLEEYNGGSSSGPSIPEGRKRIEKKDKDGHLVADKCHYISNSWWPSPVGLRSEILAHQLQVKTSTESLGWSLRTLLCPYVPKCQSDIQMTFLRLNWCWQLLWARGKFRPYQGGA